MSKTRAILSSDERYRVHFGDNIEHLATIQDECFDMQVYSPPFPQVYSYTPFAEDLGNDEDDAEVKLHFSFMFRQLLRVLKPGRVMMVHCAQIVRMKRAGGEGTFDFRGLLIRLAVRAGFVYDYDWVIRKGPQQQAIITKSRSLQFAGLEANRLQSRGAMPDYFVKFYRPGVPDVVVDSEGQVSRNEWIDWAEACWDADRYPIDSEGRVKALTLNSGEAKGPDDVKHICPFHLSTVDRLIRLYTNPDEIVFDPFSGIGSTGFVATRLGRRFYGCEIKKEYFNVSLTNIERGLKTNEARQPLLAGIGSDNEED